MYRIILLAHNTDNRMIRALNTAPQVITIMRIIWRQREMSHAVRMLDRPCTARWDVENVVVQTIYVCVPAVHNGVNYVRGVWKKEKTSARRIVGSDTSHKWPTPANVRCAVRIRITFKAHRRDNAAMSVANIIIPTIILLYRCNNTTRANASKSRHLINRQQYVLQRYTRVL